MTAINIKHENLIVEHDYGSTKYKVCVVQTDDPSTAKPSSFRKLVDEMHGWCEDTFGFHLDPATNQIRWHRSSVSFIFRDAKHATLFVMTFQGREY